MTSTRTGFPVRDGDERVSFPSSRPGFLPDIYIAKQHPLHKGHGRAYYFIMDGSPEGMRTIARLEHNELDVPSGGEEEALQRGFLKISPGDAVFARLTSSSSSGLDDVPVCWLNGSELYSDELKDRATDVRNRILGPRELRTRDMPLGTGAARVGGTRFERDFPPNENVRDGRCYPYGTSFEAIPKLYAPCAQGRLSRSTSEVLAYRSDLLNITLDMATRSVLAGSDEVANGLRMNHELLNTPAVGVPDNAFFGANQLNLSPAERGGSKSTLENSLGSAGTAHIDTMDSPAHFTNMICASDLPPGFDPGRFFILYPGVFYEQGNFVSFCFSGLRRHGGTPPVAPPGSSDEELRWATRVTLVSYPPSGSVTSGQRRVLCGDGIGGCFTVSPEMIVPESNAPEVQVNHATFAKEGFHVMVRSSMMIFFFRSLLLIVLFIIRQLPRELDVRVDSDAFLNSFSYVKENGSRGTVGPWQNGPGWRRSRGQERAPEDVQAAGSGHGSEELVSQRDAVAALYSRWLSFHAKYAGHIPYAVAVKASIRALEGWNAEDVHPKLSTVKDNKKNPADNSSSTDLTDTPNSILYQYRSKASTNKHVQFADLSTNRGPSHAVDNHIDPSLLGKPPVAQAPDLSYSHQLFCGDTTVNDWFGPSGEPSFNISKIIRTSDGVKIEQHDDNGGLGVYTGNQLNYHPDEHANMDVDCKMGESSGVSKMESLGDINMTCDNGTGSNAMGEQSIMAGATNEAVSFDVSMHPIGWCDQQLGDTLSRAGIDQEEMQLVTNADMQLFNVSAPPNPIKSTSDVNRTSRRKPKRTVSKPNIKPLPSYLKDINSEVVYLDLLTVKNNIIQNKRKICHSAGGTSANSLIYDLKDATSARPLHSSTFATIHDTMAGLHVLVDKELEDSLKLKHLRACIMFGNYACWMWLEDKIPAYACTFLIGRVDEHCPWLDSLVAEVYRLFRKRQRISQFKPEDYGLSIEGLEPAELDLSAYPYDASEPTLIDCSTANIVHDVVAKWLSYLIGGQSYWQAVYIETILSAAGLEPLVLDCVWATYHRASKNMLGRRSKVPLAAEYDIQAYPLFDRNSQLRRDIIELFDIVNMAVTGQRQSLTTENPVPIQPGDFDFIIGDRITAFKRFVIGCFDLRFRNGSTGNATLDKLLIEDGDRYLPFREHAPTRINLTKAGGPFSPSHVRSVEGVFSAVLSRATTFNTRFSREGRTLFTCPNDFFAATREIGCTDEEDYCNTSAYGQTNPGRNSDLVDIYWKTVNEDIPWPGLKASKPISFADCFSYFYPPGKSRRFPHLGMLGAYLLTADYVYAGIVEPPPLPVISTMIKRINKGPVAAFELLDMVPARTQSAHGSKHQLEIPSLSGMFEEAHHIIESCFSEDVRSDIGFDYIMTEHILCKFSRVAGGKKPIIRV